MEFVGMIKLPEPFPTRCFCWGSANGGTLGTNDNGTFRKISLRPCSINVPTKSSLISISASDRRTVVTSYSGACYSWGKPPLGRRTTSLISEATAKKLHIKYEVTIKKVIQGEAHSVILTKDGSVFSFGDANNGKLGLKNKSRGQVMLPIKVPLGKKCIDAACGFASTTLLLDGSYEGITFGITGIQSQDRKNSKSLPQIITFPTKIKNISGGTSHTAAVSVNGHCFTWGLSQNGRLGHINEYENKKDRIEVNPKRVEYFSDKQMKAEKVFCGGAHTCVIVEDGRVFSFGWNRYFQCGTSFSEDTDMDVFAPKEVNIKGKFIIDMSCGFAHTTAIDISGDLYVWGFNEEGQLGVGHEQNIREPTMVEFQDEIDFKCTIAVSAGKTHTSCIRSTCSLSEFLNRIDEIEAKRNAISIIKRFCNKLMYMVRSRRSRQLRELKNGDYNQDENDQAFRIQNEDLEGICVNDSISTECSSYLSSSEDNLISLPLLEEGDIFDKKKIQLELHLMSIEDETSKYFTSLEKRYVTELIGKKRRIINEIIRRFESFNMSREDRYSIAFRQEERDKVQDQIRSIKREEKSIRDARRNDRLKREVERMIKAKMKSTLKNNPVKKVKRRLSKGVGNNYRKKTETQVGDNDRLVIPLCTNPEYSRRLIQRRIERIAKQNQVRQKNEERQRKLNELYKKNKDYQLRIANQETLKFAADADEILERRKRRNRLELINMQQNLPTILPTYNEEFICPIRTVSQWSKKLS